MNPFRPAEPRTATSGGSGEVESGSLKLLHSGKVRDLYDAVLSELEDEIHDRDAFIHGVGYGGPGD